MQFNPGNYEFAWRVVWEYRDWLWQGVQLTLQIATVSIVLAMVFGLPLCLLRMSRVGAISSIALIYIAVMRAIPLYVFILWMYFGVPTVIGANIEAVTAGILCLTLQYSAWLAEIYRAALQAIDKGQREAALSTGLSRSRAFARVIWPQAWRIIIPPLASNYIGIIKDSSLVGVIGVNELMRQAQIADSLSFRPFELFTAAMVIYIVLALIIAPLSTLVERRAARSLSLQPRRVSRSRSSLGAAA
jgi:His/Glu/Gln/Arg/opine family amino acid ABC transporter permease subunit